MDDVRWQDLGERTYGELGDIGSFPSPGKDSNAKRLELFRNRREPMLFIDRLLPKNG